MDPGTIDLLRRQQLLRRLPDGREAVAVTLQYRGELPAMTRAARKRWLKARFAELAGVVDGIVIEPETLSVSGQTVNVVVPLEQVERFQSRLPGVLQLDVPVYRQIVDRG